jgi:hypothetical protein
LLACSPTCFIVEWWTGGFGRCLRDGFDACMALPIRVSDEEHDDRPANELESIHRLLYFSTSILDFTTIVL